MKKMTILTAAAFLASFSMAAAQSVEPIEPKVTVSLQDALGSLNGAATVGVVGSIIAIAVVTAASDDNNSSTATGAPGS